MGKDINGLSNHHRIPLSRKQDWFNVYEKVNQWLIDHTIHVNHHRYLGNMTPQEQLVALFTMNQQVMSRFSKHIMQELIHSDKHDFYKKELLK